MKSSQPPQRNLVGWVKVAQLVPRRWARSVGKVCSMFCSPLKPHPHEGKVCPKCGLLSWFAILGLKVNSSKE